MSKSSAGTGSGSGVTAACAVVDGSKTIGTGEITGVGTKVGTGDGSTIGDVD